MYNYIKMNRNSFKIYPEVPPLTLPSVVKNKNSEDDSMKFKKLFDNNNDNNNNKKLPEISSPKNNTIYNAIKKMNADKEKFIMEYIESEIDFEDCEKF
jgi:hypothetical protein